MMQLKIFQSWNSKILNIIEIDGLTENHFIILAKNLPKSEEVLLDSTIDGQFTVPVLEEMINFAEELKNFTLFLNEKIIITDDDYNSMVDIITKRKEKVPLAIRLYQNFKIPPLKFQKHREILKINWF